MNSELMTGEVKLKTWSTTTRWATRSPQDRVLRNCDGKLLKEEFYMLTSKIYTETFKIIRLQNFVVCRLFRNKRSIQKRKVACIPSTQRCQIYYFISIFLACILALYTCYSCFFISNYSKKQPMSLKSFLNKKFEGCIITEIVSQESYLVWW